MTIYLLCGIVGAGKSTWAKKKRDETEGCIIVNRDDIRKMLYGGRYVFSEVTEGVVRSIAMAAIDSAVESGLSVIIDETHITRAKRAGVIERLYGHRIVCVYFTETKDNLKNRMKSSRGVPEEKWKTVIDDMKAAFEKPDIAEGFAEIKEISI